jgi:hypothetical protein
MKKLLVVMLVLSMVSMANAAILISVNGVVDPPETEITIGPSQEVTIDIWGDGQTMRQEFYFGIEVAGPGSLNIDYATILYGGNMTSIYWMDEPDLADMGNIENPFIAFELNDIPSGDPPPPPLPLEGTLIDGIIFHCNGAEDVILKLFNMDMELEDTQVIHQPEPMTLLLLGLGGLMLRRRK